jgi:hypothetical protein
MFLHIKQDIEITRIKNYGLLCGYFHIELVGQNSILGKNARLQQQRRTARNQHLPRDPANGFEYVNEQWFRECVHSASRLFKTHVRRFKGLLFFTSV